MGGMVTEVNVNFGIRGGTDAAFAELKPAVEKLGLEALDWRTLGADFIAISQAKSAGTGTIIFLILIIAGVGISNTMLMAVFERVRELGMMRALGMKNRQIRALFLWESAGIGLLGGIYGVGLGALVNWPLVRWGIDFTFLMRDGSFGYRILGKMYGVWNLPSILTAFAMGVGMAVLVAAFSTHRILRLDIPSSLRFQ
jgi:ABC-type lipoprotein release transport system permease subunit